MLLLFPVVFIFFSCDDSSNDIIEVQTPVSIRIDSIYLPDQLIFPSLKYTALLTTNDGSVLNLFANLYNPKFEIIKRNIKLNRAISNQKTAYYCEINFDTAYPNGNYTIEILYSASRGDAIVAQKKFFFFNGKQNLPPQIYDLEFPDTVKVGQYFIFTLKAFDYNGYNDIKRVYFKLYDENGSFLAQDDMRDDGDPVYGDTAAGDAIFSYRNFFTSAAVNKIRKFEFQAEDFGGLKSSIITHYVFVKP